MMADPSGECMSGIDREIKNEADIPMTGLSAYIADLAKRHGIAYIKTGADELAEVITRLTGDVVVPDETEDLIVELKRAGAIDEQTMIVLLGNYLAERKARGDCFSAQDLAREKEQGSW